MSKKIIGTVLVIFALIFSISTAEVYARDCWKKEGYWSLEGKFSRKAHFILKNKEELGLSDKQIEKIKDLKIKTKKDLIRKNAELEILTLDVKSGLWKDTIDTDAVNKLVGKKYDLKKEKAMSLVNAYAALKDTLTKEQKEKMKDLCGKCKKEVAQCSMMEGKMKCPMCSKYNL